MAPLWIIGPSFPTKRPANYTSVRLHFNMCFIPVFSIFLYISSSKFYKRTPCLLQTKNMYPLTIRFEVVEFSKFPSKKPNFPLSMKFPANFLLSLPATTVYRRPPPGPRYTYEPTDLRLLILEFPAYFSTFLISRYTEEYTLALCQQWM